jgi:hypothetical protein
MKKFSEWQLQQEFAGVGSVDDLQVKELVKRRLEMLFNELEKMNMPRNKAIQMLALILREFQNEFALSNAAVRTAARLSTTPVTPVA